MQSTLGDLKLKKTCLFKSTDSRKGPDRALERNEYSYAHLCSTW